MSAHNKSDFEEKEDIRHHIISICWIFYSCETAHFSDSYAAIYKKNISMYPALKDIVYPCKRSSKKTQSLAKNKSSAQQKYCIPLKK